MKHIHLFILSILFSSGVFAQEKKDNYNSLLWEISGNGLQKKSYLYGTMHVSSKIAFQLSDPFFKALEDADMVALESNPENWIDNFNELGVLDQVSAMMPQYRDRENYYNGLFQHLDLDRKSLLFLFNYRNQMIDQILYRFQPGMEDYSEKTYLDMFIFQSAKKNKKPVYALENFKESYLLSLKGQIPDEDDSYDRSYVSGSDMQELYVSRDLNKLDSLIRNGYSKNYQKYMLHERNENMVDALDSIMPKGSVFSGVGAAHLPGEKGMIELLRERGYTVQPIQYYSTDKGRDKFSDWQEKVLDQKMTSVTADDGRYELSCIEDFNKSTQGWMFSQTGVWLNDQYVTDYANGGFYTVSRLATFPFLSSNIDFSNSQFLDSLLYLVVPGDIQKKKSIEQLGYKGFDIETELSNNQHMKIKVFVTPLEMIVFKVGGSKNYIKGKNAKKFIKSIVLHKQTFNEKVDIPGLNFTVNLPGERFILPNDSSRNHNFEGYSYDTDKDAYYLVKSVLKTDHDYIEEDAFELEYFIENMTHSLEVDTFTFELKEDFGLFTFQKGNQKIYGKILKKGLQYYLLMTNDKNEESKSTFLESFQFKTPTYDYSYTVDTDSTMLFSSKVPKREMDKESYEALKKGFEDIRRIYSERYKDETEYLGKNEESVIYNPYTSENIRIKLYTTNQYNWSSQTDLRKNLEERGQNMYGNELNRDSTKVLQYQITDSTINDSITHYSFEVSRSKSKNIIQGDIWHYRNSFYESSIVRDENTPSSFYNTFVDNFTPFDTNYTALSQNGLDSTIIADIQSSDSTTSVRAINTLESYIPYDTSFVIQQLKEIVNHHSFEYENSDKKIRIFNTLSNLMEPVDFVTYMETIANSNENSKIRESAIVNLTYHNPTKEGYLAFAKQIEKDPLTVLLIEDKWDYYLTDSIELTALLVPELLKINENFPDTKENYIWEYGLCLDSGVIDKKVFNLYKQSILIKAMQNTRKVLLEERNNESEMSENEWQFSLRKEFNYYNLDDHIKNLLNEIHFLFHYRDEEQVASLFEKIAEIKNENVQFYLYRLFHMNRVKPMNEKAIQEIISTSDGKYRFVRYLSDKAGQNILDTIQVDVIDYLTAYAQHSQSNFYYEGQEKDSISFLKKVDVQNYIDTSSTYIFEKWEGDELDQYIVFKYVPEKVSDFDEIVRDSKSFYSYSNDKNSKKEALRQIENGVLYSDRLRISQGR